MSTEVIIITVERKKGDKVYRSQHAIDGNQFDYFLDQEHFLMRIIAENRKRALKESKEKQP